jgi:glycosyltransferase involved in cell wall biosynthesis
MDCDLEGVEVIVVDDESPAGTGEIVASFQDRLRLRVVRQRRGGPARARNTGAESATGSITAFIDDDCIPARNWLAAMLRALSAHPDALVGGPVVNGLSGNPYAAASQSIATFVAAHYASGKGAERFFTTNNFALATARLREVGGFDATIPSWTAEDKEFCDRWRRRGNEMIWVEDAIVEHFHDLTFRKFVRQHFDYGRGILTFRMRRNARAGSGGKIVPESVAFYSQLVTHPLIERRDLRATILVALSQIATLAGAVSSAISTGRWSASRAKQHELAADLGDA